MSRCGNCRSRTCSCLLLAGCDAVSGSCVEVLGIGATYEPFQARLTVPEYRLVGAAHRTTSQLLAIGNNVITFEATALPITAGNMWNIAQPTRLTATIAGLYLIYGYVNASGAGSGQTLSVSIQYNGSELLSRRVVTTQNGGNDLLASVTTLQRLALNDYVELRADSSDVNGTATTLFSFESGPYFAAQRMAA